MCIYHIFFLLTYRCRLEAQSTDGVHYNRKSGRSRKGGGEGRICTLLLLLLRVPPAVVVVVVIVVLLPRSLPLSLPVSIQLLLFFSSIILFGFFCIFFVLYNLLELSNRFVRIIFCYLYWPLNFDDHFKAFNNGKNKKNYI